MRSLALGLLATWFGLTAGACSRDAANYGRCRTVFDCRTGQACGQGRCADGPAAPVAAYGVELLPASNVSGGPVRNEVPGVALDGGDIALQFEQPVELSGRVLYSAQAVNPQSVGASITVTRQSRIGLAQVTSSVQAAAGRAVGDAAFSLNLPRTKATTDADCLEPDHDCYEVHVVPTELNLYPPLFLKKALPAARALDVELAGTNDLMVTGSVKDAALLGGLGGLEVRAVDGDGRTVSSVVTTRSDAENAGKFLLAMSPETGVDRYWLQIAESQDHPDVPRFLYALEVGAAGANATVDLGDVALLDFQWPVVVSYRVKGPASNGKQEAVQGALVRFTTYLRSTFSADKPSGCQTDKCAVYTRQATTDDKGEVTLNLIPPGPGGYEVEILPGPNSPYSALHKGGVEVDQPGVGADFGLVRKLEVRGTVVDALGQALGGATVTATPRDVPVSSQGGIGGSPAAMKSADLALDEPPSTMQTDEAGQFLLMLEPGVSYDVVVTPAATSPAPITTIVGQVFHDATTLNLQLPEAALLAGAVTSWDGTAAEGALVRVYEVVTDVDTTATTAWLRGEAVAKADGSFKLLLPAGAPGLQ